VVRCLYQWQRIWCIGGFRATVQTVIEGCWIEIQPLAPPGRFTKQRSHLPFMFSFRSLLPFKPFPNPPPLQTIPQTELVVPQSWPRWLSAQQLPRLLAMAAAAPILPAASSSRRLVVALPSPRGLVVVPPSCARKRARPRLQPQAHPRRWPLSVKPTRVSLHTEQCVLQCSSTRRQRTTWWR
jgi:hypothetical protein